MNEAQKEHIESMKEVMRNQIAECRRGIKKVEEEECEGEEHLIAKVSVLKTQALECVNGMARLKAQEAKYEAGN